MEEEDEMMKPFLLGRIAIDGVQRKRTSKQAGETVVRKWSHSGREGMEGI